MAIYKTPQVSAPLSEKLNRIDQLRRDIGTGTASPAKWVAQLRREVEASAYSSSTRIEGFNTTQIEAVAIVEGASPLGGDDENALALECYLHAMRHVGVMAADARFVWHERVLLDLHFDACSFQADKNPGAFRNSGIGVTDPYGGLAYEGPAAAILPELISEFIDWLRGGDLEAHFVVRAAMAHLHLASIHPFEDGNGRLARILQSLVLAGHGGVAPEFGSIEEYLAENTDTYYRALGKVQCGKYSPQNNALSWVEFCVDGHVEQAERRLAQIRNAAERWAKIESIVEARGWPDRISIALEQVAMGATDRAKYVRESDVSTPTASGDFRRLQDSGFVAKVGQGPSTKYVATAQLLEALGLSVPR